MSKGLRDIAQAGLSHLQSFSRIKMIAVDLDGTMSGSAILEIWENIIWLIKRLNHGRNKTSLIIATGRTLTGAKPAIRLLYHTRDLPIILYNGSLVINNNTYEVLYQKTIPNLVLAEIAALSDLFAVNVFAYYYVGKEKNLFDTVDSLEYVLGFGRDRSLVTEFNQMPIIWEFDASYLVNAPSAILIDIRNIIPGDKERILERLAVMPEISVTSSGLAYVEIRPAGSNKAEALRFVADNLKLSATDFAAIGDNNNDVEMLSWVGTGIAVSNGTDSAINAAKYVCSHNVASGVIEVLRLIKQSKRYHDE
jgi:Cof subfamily protein (haloacid dehalogenase superfamily)